MQGVIFIGLQASGKTSFYFNSFGKSHIHLNLDMLKTRHREQILFDACLRAKQSVVIDNTNPTKQDRRRYIERFNEHKFEVIGYYFASKLEDCLYRNALRDGSDQIPEVGIKGTYGKLELPKYSEGFDQLYYVTIEDGSFTVKEWKDEI